MGLRTPKPLQKFRLRVKVSQFWAFWPANEILGVVLGCAHPFSAVFSKSLFVFNKFDSPPPQTHLEKVGRVFISLIKIPKKISISKKVGRFFPLEFERGIEFIEYGKMQKILNTFHDHTHNLPG